MEKEMQYYLADVSELIPYVRNARTHSEAQVAQIAASIREFGFLSPILVAEDNTILAGHGRLAAALKLGLKKVPCVKENHLTETQKRAYIIADNKLSLNAGWDSELLAVELSELEGADFNLDLLGFDEAELSSIFDADKDVSDDDFDVEKELEEPCFSKTGDIWTLGKHRVICGDATKLETFKTLLEDTKVNLVVTDPPYNVNYEGSAGKIKNDNMEDDKFYQFLFNSFVNMEQAMADDASIYVFHADTEGLNFRKAFQDAGFYLSGCCIWKKPSLVLGRSPYQWQHEPCLYGWKKKGKHKWYAGRKETSVWEFEKSKKNADHPTMKPIALLAYPIKNSSMTNSLVLDPFAGSGSTLIACEQTGRICYAIELDEKYCDVIVKRYIEQVGNDKSVKVLRGGKEYSFTEVCANE
ncbi:site-specific DNA-methyltransferase [Gardnerella vaginalis]|uniref:site-specific DNA-methyltransferase n=1 Tax=Gardnerella vaginalis TaxID=2702 RepID=UPI00254D4A5E|nr:site-specific DNA-methyltransferase [Gardnerella vaginalis]MDK7259636.1 site-specific DNA-methyltransferase [Gardnerella vaginalis]MDK8776840.1 site-specific DNA-methyltransferase [Gardnerella vaginalis]